jgi:hypothetical protein
MGGLVVIVGLVGLIVFSGVMVWRLEPRVLETTLTPGEVKWCERHVHEERREPPMQIRWER